MKKITKAKKCISQTNGSKCVNTTQIDLRGLLSIGCVHRVTNPVLDILYIRTYLPILFLSFWNAKSVVGHTPLKGLATFCVVLIQCPCMHTHCATRVVQRWAGISSVYRRLLFPLHRWIVAESNGAAGPDPGLSWLLSRISRVNVYPYLPMTVG